MPDAALALLIDRFMRRIHSSLQSKASEFDSEKVGPGGGMVLMTLADMGETEMGELSRRVARDKSQMTRLMRGLEDKGLIQRCASPADARVSLVSLTPDGCRFAGVLQSAVADVIDEILSEVSPQDRTHLRGILERVLT